MWEIAFGWRDSGIVLEQDGRGSDRVTKPKFFHGFGDINEIYK